MNAKPELTHVIQEVARRLRVAPKRLEDGQDTIDEILDYFETGHLEGKQRVGADDLSRVPHFVRPRLLRVGPTLLSVRSVARRTHPLLPSVHEAFVTFAVEDDDGIEIPTWNELTSDTPPESDGNVAFTFTSAVPLRRNLVDFVTFVTSPRLETSRSEGTSVVRDWLTNVSAARDDVFDTPRTAARDATGQGQDLGLTPRERVVLRLLAEGRSDRQIAEALFISGHAAHYHIATVMNKLNVRSRQEAARQAPKILGQG